MIWRHVRARSALLWYLLFFMLLIIFVSRSREEIRHTTAIIRAADVYWLAGAVAIEVVILLGFVATLGLILRRIGYRPGWPVLIGSHFQRFVAGTLSPISGPASTFAFTRYMRTRGVATDDALLTLALNGVVGYGSFVAFLIPALIFLEIQHDVSRLLLIGAGVLIVIFILLVIGLYLLLRDSSPPGWLVRRVPERATAFASQVRRHRVRPGELLQPFLIACCVELLGVLLLYLCLRAIGEDPTLATALTAYAVGTTFVIISPVFSGIGLVELGMVVALHQFGIPEGSALAATLLYRAVELWLPLATGLSIQVGSRPELRKFAPQFPALLTFFTGLMTILSMFAPDLHGRFNELREYTLFTVPALSRTFIVVTGFFLIFLSYSLWKRKRIAWFAAVLLLAGSVPAHVLKHHDELIALLAAANLGLLLYHYPRYRVRSDIPLLRQGVWRFILALLFALLYGTIGFFLIDERSFGINFSPEQAVGRTLRTFFSLGNSGLTPHTRYGAWFLDSIQIIGVVSVGYAIFSLVRPVVWRRTAYERERLRARDLITQYGNSSLDFFKYWDDKLFFFSANGRAVVSFGLARGTAVALGDPVAASAEDFRDVFAEFLEYCDVNGWRVAFHQTSGAHLRQYREAGLRTIKIGEDAVVDLDAFTLSGGKMKSLRTQVRRMERDGYRVAYYPPPQTESRIKQLREVSDEWLTLQGRRERRFTLGEFRRDYVRNSPIFTIEDSLGQICAFINLVSVGAENETTIDLMRRRADADGVMDLLFVRAFEHTRDTGYHRFSLGMAPFANVGTADDVSVPERIISELYEHLNRVFSYKGLRLYKDKFHPDWEPRYLVYQSDATLALVALSIIRLTE